ncbi:MAG: M20/M25/M40 family metallo-hydrolase, partial [Saprospiraceae bacterium]|nr:M20/M25/M40 family metallo-hydrolase [Saprospiraceae bacterium]
MKWWFLTFFFSTFAWAQLTGQTDNEDAFFVKGIYNTALTQGKSYEWLHHLSTQIGGRLSGSPQAMAAVEFTKQMLDTLGLDSVWLQPCLVPHWVRGEKEQVRIVNSSSLGSFDLNGVALGNSIGTGKFGITAEVVEVQSLDELESLGEQKLTGKIVFFNRPMDATQLNTFAAYGGAADQRVFGPIRAAKLGAVAAIVRSLTTRLDGYPHTGSTMYDPKEKNIPALAISTNDAVRLSTLLAQEKVSIFIKTTCQHLSPKLSYNVIGEIKGKEKPEEIILVGGHLDSWDLGQGAHDDGAGCVQAMEVLHLFKRLNYQPQRTIRCVLFMNEENGQKGAMAYRDSSEVHKEFHLAAIESDAGGFTPRGFSCDGETSIF